MKDWKLQLRSALESNDPDRTRQAAEMALGNTPDRYYTQYSDWQVEHQVEHLVSGRLDELEFSVDEDDDGLRRLIENEVRDKFSARVFNALVGDVSFWSAVEIEIRAVDDDPFIQFMDDAVTTVADPTIEEMFEDEVVLIEVLAFVKDLMESAASGGPSTVNPSVEVAR